MTSCSMMVIEGTPIPCWEGKRRRKEGREKEGKKERNYKEGGRERGRGREKYMIVLFRVVN